MHSQFGTTFLVCVIAATGCSLFAPGELRLDASADARVAAPDEPVLVTVTATNVGEDDVSWGAGSSICQLELVVRVDGQDRSAISPRLCTLDLVTHELSPGESQTETLRWDGRVRMNETAESIERLPPGTYEIRGVAGDIRSDPVLITLEH